MNSRRVASRLMIVVGAFLASSCARVPIYVNDPGVTIDKVPTSTGRVASANFWADKQGFTLRGEVVPQPITKGPLGGHVDIVITAPDGASTECMTTRQQMRVRHVRKPYSIRFAELPISGSVVQVKHHDSADHDDCAG